MITLRELRNATIATLVFAGTASAQAGLLSNTATVTINASKSASLSVTINSGGTQSLASLSDNAVNDFGTPVSVTTAWDINPSASSVVLVGYFAAPSQALSSGSEFIASSLVKGRLGTSGGYSAFTGGAVGGAGVAGGTLQLFSQSINGTNKKSNRTDDLYLQIDLTGQSVSPGSYAGTLNLRAVTQ